ncbi:MAG: hypothetical protein HC893_11230 [Chloroflexaceae bacterium]|nr:hypothetical protein [Chloroflexaceae bacterium]NJL34323.1 hypothetical protein [Chloroflexaceae bacterium]NJO07375.1 hypothetical protein [Chloroflexaceae bacterium]
MLKNMDRQKATLIGIGLIVLGVVIALDLWALLPVLVLGTLGGYLYRQRRIEGRIGAAVQSGLWLIGLAFLFLIDFVLPGLLILAGTSLVVRGREPEIDRRVTALLARVGVQLSTTQYTSNALAVPVQPAPQAAAPQPQAEVKQDEPANTGETVRL